MGNTKIESGSFEQTIQQLRVSTCEITACFKRILTLIGQNMREVPKDLGELGGLISQNLPKLDAETKFLAAVTGVFFSSAAAGGALCVAAGSGALCAPVYPWAALAIVLLGGAASIIELAFTKVGQTD